MKKHVYNKRASILNMISADENNNFHAPNVKREEKMGII